MIPALTIKKLARLVSDSIQTLIHKIITLHMHIRRTCADNNNSLFMLLLECCCREMLHLREGSGIRLSITTLKLSN